MEDSQRQYRKGYSAVVHTEFKHFVLESLSNKYKNVERNIIPECGMRPNFIS